MSSPRPGDLLTALRAALAPRYRVEREIGHGGMAVVFRGEDVTHGRPVAIKIVKPELAAVLGTERFLREIALTARLSHPHIVPLIESGVADSLPFYVMPYIEGESLRHKLSREKQLPVDEAIRITREVASALSAAHRLGVVHRDIKPANILLHGGLAIVADFGVARALVEAGGEKLTATGMAVGTPGYMSPEQATGGDVDARCDIYSLGSVLFEMLTGETPYTGPSVQAIVAKQLSLPVPSATTVRDAVSPALDDVLRRALAKVPADRYATVEGFDAALAAASLAPPRRRVRWLPVAIAAGVAIAGALAVWRLAAPPQPAIDAHRVVVFPLVATTPDLNRAAVGWNVALAVGSALEHTQPLTWIDGQSWLPFASGNAPTSLTPPAARNIALARGARYFIDGAIRGDSGMKAVVLRLHDALGDSLLAQESAEGVAGASFEELGLRAVVGLLPRLVDPGRRIDLSPLTDRAPGAIALSIQGDREYRRSQFAQALDFYQRAVAQDSLLAFAAVKGAEAAAWTNQPPAAERLLHVALAQERLLPLKYRYYARGMLAYHAGAADSALTAFRAALGVDGDWSEARMALGEVYYHLLPQVRNADSLAEAAFTAAAADTFFTPPVLHLGEMAVRHGHLAQASALLNRLRHAGSDTTWTRRLDIMIQCADRGPDHVDWAALAASSPDPLVLAAKQFASSAALPACGVAAFRAVLGRGEASSGYRWAALLGLQGLLLAQGRYREARAVLDSNLAAGVRATYTLYVFDELAGAPYADGAAEADRFARAGAGEFYARGRPETRWLLGIWRARHGDLAALDTITNDVMRTATASGTSQDRLLADALQAHRALALGDTTAAIARLRQLRPGAPGNRLAWEQSDPQPIERYLLAELLFARGQYDEAEDVAAAFDQPGPVMYLPYLPASLAIRIAVAEATGRTSLAAVYRKRLAALGWKDAAPARPFRAGTLARRSS